MFDKAFMVLIVCMACALPFLVDEGYGCGFEQACGTCQRIFGQTPQCAGRIYGWSDDPDHVWENAQNSGCQSLDNVGVGEATAPSSCLAWHEEFVEQWIADPTECKPDRMILYSYYTIVVYDSTGEDIISFPPTSCPATVCTARCKPTNNFQDEDWFIDDYGQLTGMKCTLWDYPCGIDDPQFDHTCINNIQEGYPTLCTCAEFDEVMEMYEMLYEPNVDGCANDVFQINGPITGGCPSACDWLDKRICLESPDWETTAQDYLNANCKCKQPNWLGDTADCPFTHVWCSFAYESCCTPN